MQPFGFQFEKTGGLGFAPNTLPGLITAHCALDCHPNGIKTNHEASDCSSLCPLKISSANKTFLSPQEQNFLWKTHLFSRVNRLKLLCLLQLIESFGQIEQLQSAQLR